MPTLKPHPTFREAVDMALDWANRNKTKIRSIRTSGNLDRMTLHIEAYRVDARPLEKIDVTVTTDAPD